MSHLWQKPAHELARLIQKRQLSSLEVTQDLLDRIAVVNPKINALVVPCFEQALQQARNWDAAPKAGARLGGVPFSVKEIINVAGMPCTIGSMHRHQVVARQNATVVQRLLNAGGILLGLSNLPERSFWCESYNHIYGRTSNPYDPARTPGGSSGGEAALIGAGGSPLGLGSDIAGSIRIPAFFCGVFGHKPSAGLVPATGHYPFELPLKLPDPIRGAPLYMCIGPLAHSASDLLLALELLAGPDGIDPTCTHTLPPAVGDFDWHERTVFVMPRPRIKYCSAVQPEIARAVVQAAKVFKQLGARIEELPDTLFTQAMEIWSAAISEGGESMAQMLGDGQTPIPLLQESLKLFSGRSQHTPPALLFAWMDKVQGKNRQRLRATLQEAARLRATIERRLGDRHLMLLPPQPTVAPRHDELLSRPLDFAYTAIINVLQLPATAIPMGLNAQGLPLGVQVIGGRLQDRLCLQAALELEQACGGWTRPLKLKAQTGPLPKV
ncbi:MAG: amidase [Candidatus Sericytochromatia bacterium]